MPDAGGCAARNAEPGCQGTARLRASAFMLSCRPPKSGLLFYLIALILLT